MDEKQNIIIVLLAFIAVMLFVIVSPDSKETLAQIGIGIGVLAFAFVLLKAVFEAVREKYWAFRRFIDRQRGRIHH